MKASGSRSARMATYSAVQGPMPGSATSERRSSAGSAPGSITTSPASTAWASATRARRRPAGMAKAPGSRPASSASAAGVGKRCVTAPSGVGQRFAGGLDQPSGHGARPGDRDLLADDGAHGELEAVDGAGHPPPGIAPRPAAPTSGSSAQRLPDGDGVGIEVEQLAAARHGRVQVAQVRQRRARPPRRPGPRLGLSGVSGARSVTTPCPWGSRRLRGRTRRRSSSTPGRARRPRNSSTDAGSKGAGRAGGAGWPATRALAARSWPLALRPSAPPGPAARWACRRRSGARCRCTGARWRSRRRRRRGRPGGRSSRAGRAPSGCAGPGPARAARCRPRP